MVAVGGNALTGRGQRGTADEIAANAAEHGGAASPTSSGPGGRVAVVHGNGPQVGNLALQQDGAQPLVPAQPLHRSAR